MSIDMVVNLPISLFLLFRKNAWLHNQYSSEKGREMLKDFWRLMQTEPDIEAVRRFQKRGEQ